MRPTRSAQGRELGRRLYIRGVVGDPMDIFFAHAGPLEAAVLANDDKQWRVLGEAIRAEKESYQCDLQRTPAWILDEEHAGLERGTTVSGPPAEPGSSLRGLPGSPGQVLVPFF